MMDSQKLTETKDLILAFIRARGPSLPVHIARDVKTSPLFASAFLSELYREQKIRMSDMKVGSSRLYLLQGQEKQLENFIQFLNQKEQQAFSLIRKEKLLDDEKLEPAIRVAMRAIRDFALPIKLTIRDQEKLFWKYAFLTDEEAELLITGKKPKDKIEKREQIQSSIEKPKIKQRKVKNPESDFTKKIKEYLSAKDIEILSVVEEKKNLFTAKVRTNDFFGKQEYYLMAKDKKKIKEEDLAHVLHKAQNEKMLALLMAPADIDKHAQELIKEYRNLIKFEKVKF